MKARVKIPIEKELIKRDGEIINVVCIGYGEGRADDLYYEEKTDTYWRGEYLEFDDIKQKKIKITQPEFDVTIKIESERLGNKIALDIIREYLSTYISDMYDLYKENRERLKRLEEKIKGGNYGSARH
ncbi:MAG: hypothetical protein ACFFDN_13970 [Candidatus Hodarchaeota archaeon]